MDNDESESDTQTRLAGQHAMNRMCGFAILTEDWHKRRRSFLDNFINFVLSVMSSQPISTLTSQDVVKSLSNTYGIQLPERIIHQILRRAQKFGYIERNNNSLFKISERGLDQIPTLSPKLQALAQEQVDLGDAFVLWANAEFSTAITTNEASEALLNYLETYYGSLLSSAKGSGSIGSLPPVEPTQLQKFSAAFVGWLSTNDPKRFEHVLNIAQGSMLAAALFSPSPIQLDSRFEDTTVLLDTKILLRALGYEGEETRIATLDYVNLLVKQGGRVAIFDFTLGETKSILSYNLQLQKSGRLWTARPGTVGAYYFSTNASAGQIDLEMAQLEVSLRKINIDIQTEVPLEELYVIDEQAIEEKILEYAPGYRRSGLAHDVRALAAVVRMRRGRARDSLERCRAVFVTVNSLVLRASKEVPDLHDQPWPVAMYEADVATLAWIKSSPSAPQLPRNMLVAVCLGVLRPSDTAWKGYVRELERLHDGKEISVNDLLLVRQKYEQDNMVFVQIGGSHGEGSDEQIVSSIKVARAAVTADIEAPLKLELSASRNRQDLDQTALVEMRGLMEKQQVEIEKQQVKIQTTVSELIAQNSNIRSSIETRSRRDGRLVQYAVTIVLSILVLVSLLPMNVLDSSAIRTLSTMVITLAIVLGGLLTPGKHFGLKIEKWLLARRLADHGMSNQVD